MQAFMESNNFALTNRKDNQVVSTFKHPNITFSSEGVATNLQHMQDGYNCKVKHREENKKMPCIPHYSKKLNTFASQMVVVER